VYFEALFIVLLGFFMEKAEITSNDCKLAFTWIKIDVVFCEDSVTEALLLVLLLSG